MNSSRRTTLLLSALASAAFWLLVDTPSRLASRRFQLDGYDPWPSDLAVVPVWKLLVLLGVTALVFYALARTVRAFGRTPRQRRLLWPLALAALGVLGHTAYGWMEDSAVDDWRRDHHLPLRFERQQLAGSAWWNVIGGDCGYVAKEIIVFESATRARRYHYGGYLTALYPFYAALDVWPHGEWTASGEVTTASSRGATTTATCPARGSASRTGN